MSSSLARTKRRIASIGNTRKLTRAMELIAMAKLRKGMDSLASRRLYLGEWRKALSLVKRQMAGDREEEAKPENGGRGHRLVIAVYSDLGLCGSYNGDMDALLAREVAEGDRLIVPQYTATVKINGEVMYPNTVGYQKGKKASYYIDQAGGYSSRAKKSQAYIIYMNGTIAKVSKGAKPLPGCEIFVPEKNVSAMTLAEKMSLGTTAASIATMIATLVNILQ